MTKWDYRTVLRPAIENQLEAVLIGMGNQGWELCPVSGSYLVFKRPYSDVLQKLVTPAPSPEDRQPLSAGA